MPFDMNSLFSNKLFLQYLSNLGQGIQQGNVAGALNQVTQQNISSQNFMQMMQQMLGGGAKVSMDKDNLSIKAPSNALAGIMGTGNPSSHTPNLQGFPAIGERAGSAAPQSLSSVSPNVSGTNASFNPMLAAFLGGNMMAGGGNPSASPLGNFSAADLAGLTPENIGQAVNFKMMQEELGEKRATKILESLQNQQKMQLEYEKLLAGERTSDIKNYEYAVNQGFKGSFQDFKDSTSTAHIKDYEYAVSTGYKGTFQQWLTEIAKAGGTTINVGERAFEGARGRDAASVMAPDLYTKATETVIKRNPMFKAPGSDKLPEFKDAVRGEMENQILQMFPTAKRGTVSTKEGKIAGWWVDAGEGKYKLIQRDPFKE